MANYQTSQLEAASKMLTLLGVPYPHTLQEKTRTIEASKAAVSTRFKGTVDNYCIAMKEIALAIKADRFKRKYHSLNTPPTKICVTDWRDDSGQLFWV
jgi:hypothetical protein